MVSNVISTRKLYGYENKMAVYLTTVYKEGLSTVGHLYNLLTKNVTKYPVLTTYKIPKNKKKLEMFFYFWEFYKLLELNIL